MNYYPYFNSFPVTTPKVGLFKSLFGGINFSSIVNGTQKTLGLVNQAIPLIKQAKPVLNNAKTMFKVMNEFKKVDTPITVSDKKENINTSKEVTTASGPTFFQ